ncbi:MAG TPA: GNAT family N-acetyltransferase, partial [Thermoguttaceae bacterium]|nr:GNAT family N-acetyltransferase [Thermoguttaceae bacterium]
MDSVVVKPVQTRQEKRAFLNFPWTLYKDDPYWIPPLRIDQKEMVNYKPHPFYIRNEIQTFLAYRRGEVCGRIAAIINHGHNERYNERRGFFGFFECVDDQEAAKALFDAAKQWLADRGMTALRGPTNPSLNYTLGLLVEGFNSSPYFMMTYNPPYYEKLVLGCGFEKTQDLYAYWGKREMLPGVHAKLQPICDQIRQRMNITLRELNPKRFLEDVEAFLEVYNRSLTATWGFVPMSKEEIRHLAAGLRWLIVPQLALGAEIDGKLVGATFGLLDYNPRIRAINGRLFPFGFIRLLWNKQDIKAMRLISTNVVPEYQRLGVGVVLLNGLVPRGLEWGLEEVEFSWVLESNLLSRGSLEKGGA